MRYSFKYAFGTNKFTVLCISSSICCLFLFCFYFNVFGYWILLPSYRKMMERNRRILSETSVVGDSLNVQEVRDLFGIYNGVRNKTNDKEHINFKANSTSKYILWYNKPNFINLTFANNALKSDCIYTNCRMFHDEKKIDRFTAVVFSVTDPLDSKPPITSSQRNPNQVWIYFSLEPPVDHDYLSYRRFDWINTMNWSMTYETGSDVFFPYGMLEFKRETDMIFKRDYGALFHSKKKQVAWIVSHCGAPSSRDEYVNELKKFGIDIEIFGRCGNKFVRDRKQLTDHIQKNFKFLLSFESSFCKDYISEKFFSYYNLDVVLVVRGGGDYDRLLPAGTFINTAHFISPQSLAGYLIKIGSSEEMFTEYLKNKDRYIASDLFSIPTGYCSLCEKLNKLDENRVTYVDHAFYRQNGSCWEPKDVAFSRTSWTKTCLCLILLLLAFALLLLSITQPSYKKINIFSCNKIQVALVSLRLIWFIV